jgi:hypothetical protein
MNTGDIFVRIKRTYFEEVLELCAEDNRVFLDSRGRKKRAEKNCITRSFTVCVLFNQMLLG